MSKVSRRFVASSLAALVLVAFQPVGAQATSLEEFSKMQCGVDVGLDRSRFSRVVDDLEVNGTLTIEGPEWNDTLITNCKVTGAAGDGIEIRDVRNLAIENCEISGVGGTGIRLRSSGSTQDVWLVGNRITNVGDNGISAAKRLNDDVDHTRLVIADNIVNDSGARGKRGLTHGIYTQASDVTIFGNTVSGERDGNGISIRSSGLVACNSISGISDDNKPGIRYFADNYAGPSRTLIIRDNEVRDSNPAIELRRPDGWTRRRPEALVTRFVIEGNRTTSGEPVSISSFWADDERFSLTIENNLRVGG